MENHQEHNRFFGTMPPTRLFFKCAVPSMISMAVTSLYTIADGIFVGRFIGAEALAAINLVMPLIMMSFALTDMIAVGSSVQISIRLGEQKREEADRIFSFCCLLIVGISVFMGAAAWIFGDDLVRLMGAEPDIIQLAVEYMRVYALFAPVIMIFFAVDNYLRICGRIRYSMVMNILISVLNIVLDFLFIVQLGWGVWSASLASCISLSVGTVAGFLPFLRRKVILQFVRGTLTPRMIGNIFANGSSEFFSNITGSVFMLIINTVLLRLAGAMAVAAFSIVMYVDSIVKSLLFGMCDALQPAISFNYGAGKVKRVYALERRVLLAAALISIIVLAWMQLAGHTIVGLFVQEEETSFLKTSIRAMQLFSLSYLFSWFDMAASSFFTALNRPIFSLIVSVCQALIFPALCLTLLTMLLKLDGVWLTALFSSSLTAVLAGALFIQVIRSLRRLQAQQPESPVE